MAQTPADVVIAGLGPTGLTAALALCRLGLRTVLVGRPPDPATDTRTMALMGPSVTLLENLGVWDACAPHAQPLAGIRIIDATGRLLRAPETTFTAAEVGLASFGACITTADLLRVLCEQARRTPELTIVETTAIAHIEIGQSSVQVTTAEGETVAASLLVGADGRQSPSRAAAGIRTQQWDYPQTALAATFEHTRTHAGVSIEFHRPAGPLTTVPLRPSQGIHASSLVWVEQHAEAQRLLRLDDAAFAATLRTQLQGVLGGIGKVSRRTAFPLTALRATPMARARTALIGEAAHVMPPIGAQGLNLGLRDVAGLCDVAAEAMARAQEPGARPAPDLGVATVLERYEKLRRPDVWLRMTAVDLLNRSLLSGQLPIQAARSLGLQALGSFGPLRRALIRGGLASSGQLPSLMRRP